MTNQDQIRRDMMRTDTRAYTDGLNSEFNAPNPYDRKSVEYWQFVRGYAKKWIDNK